MIKAKITYSSLEITGHAPREPGAKENLLCAAVSALTQTARDALQEIGGVTLTNSKEESGHILAEWMPMDQTTEGRTILKAFEVGLRNLAESYPGTIEVISFGL